MSGRFVPSIRFPLFLKGCKSARLQVEPILCPEGYGIEIKIILTMTAEHDKDKYEYEKIVQSIYLTQASLPKSNFYDTAYEYFEGFYYNKVSQDIVVPMLAAILKTYVPNLLIQCGLDLSDYYIDSSQFSKIQSLGFGK